MIHRLRRKIHPHCHGGRYAGDDNDVPLHQHYQLPDNRFRFGKRHCRSSTTIRERCLNFPAESRGSGPAGHLRWRRPIPPGTFVLRYSEDGTLDSADMRHIAPRCRKRMPAGTSILR